MADSRSPSPSTAPHASVEVLTSFRARETFTVSYLETVHRYNLHLGHCLGWRILIVILAVFSCALGMLCSIIIYSFEMPPHQMTLPRAFRADDLEPGLYRADLVDDVPETSHWRRGELVYRQITGSAPHARLLRHNFATGEETEVCDKTLCTDLHKTHRLQLSSDGRWAMMHFHHQPDVRRSFEPPFDARADYDRRLIHFHLLDVHARRNAGPTSPKFLLHYIEFGPYGSQLAFVDRCNVYYQASPDELIEPLTHNGWTAGGSGRQPPAGVPYVCNGMLPPAYRRDLITVREHAFWWSGSGSHLAVGEFTTADSHGTNAVAGEPLAAPRVNEPLPVPRLRVFSMPNATQKPEIVIGAPAQLGDPSREPAGEAVLLAVAWSEAGAGRMRLVSMWTNRWQQKTYLHNCDIQADNLAKCETREVPAQHGSLDAPRPLWVGDRIGRDVLMLAPATSHRRQELYVYPRKQTSGQHRLSSVRNRGQRADGERSSNGTLAVNVQRLLHWDNDGQVLFYLANTLTEPQHRHLYAEQGLWHAGVSGQCLTCGDPPLQGAENYTHFDATFAADGWQLLLRAQGPPEPRYFVYQWSVDETRRVRLRLLGPVYADSSARRSRLVAERLGGTLPTVRYFEVPILHSSDDDNITERISARVQLTYPPHYDRQFSAAHAHAFPALLVPQADGPGHFGGTAEWRIGWPELMAAMRRLVVVRIDASGSLRRGEKYLEAVRSRMVVREADELLAVVA